MILTRRFYMVLILIILLMGSGYAFAPLFTIGQGVLFLLLLSVLADGYMLYRIRGIRAFRQCSARFSNGDENAVNLRVESCYPYPVFAEVIDEVPFIFQQRNISFRVQLQANEGKQSVIIYVRQAGNLWFRTDSRIRNRSDRFALPALYMRRGAGY
jgi:uncharacterized protein (DUF58 family)